MKFMVDITAGNGIALPKPAAPWAERMPCVTGWLLDNVSSAEEILLKHLGLDPSYSGMVVIDAEEEHVRSWDGSAGWLRDKILSFQKVLPRARFGVYGIPSRFTWEWTFMDGLAIKDGVPADVGQKIADKMYRDFRLLRSLRENLDFSCPTLYLMYPAQDPSFNKRNIDRARLLMPGKPCVPYVSMNLEGKWIKGTIPQKEWDTLILGLLKDKIPACVIWDYFDREVGSFNHRWFPLTTPSSLPSGVISRVMHAVKVFVGKGQVEVPEDRR